MMAQTSHRDFIWPPWQPPKPTVMAPYSVAVFNASKMLGESPLVLIAKATSRGLMKVFSCSEKTRSYPKSLAHAVISEVLSVSAMTRGRLPSGGPLAPLLMSHIRCEALAALPPLPKTYTVRCSANASRKMETILLMELYGSCGINSVRSRKYRLTDRSVSWRDSHSRPSFPGAMNTPTQNFFNSASIWDCVATLQRQIGILLQHQPPIAGKNRQPAHAASGISPTPKGKLKQM